MTMDEAIAEEIKARATAQARRDYLSMAIVACQRAGASSSNILTRRLCATRIAAFKAELATVEALLSIWERYGVEETARVELAARR